MTPKEKAKELVYKFYPSVQWKLGQEDCLDRAKQCALIAVEMMIEETRTKYWYDVKQEIEKITKSKQKPREINKCQYCGLENGNHKLSCPVIRITMII